MFAFLGGGSGLASTNGFRPRLGLCGLLPIRYGQKGQLIVVQRRTSAAFPSRHSRQWRPAVANAMRQAIGLIGEAAFSEDPLSKERQQEFLKPFYEVRNGDLVPIDGEATDVAVLVLMAVQVSRLAEKMVPLPEGRKIKAEAGL